ncbi:uncharacterized protein LOC144352013 [Saccoglossus kowalevskii]
MHKYFRWLQSRRTRTFRGFSVIVSLWAIYYLSFSWTPANIFAETEISEDEEFELESNEDLRRQKYPRSDIKNITSIEKTNVSALDIAKRNMSIFMRKYVLPLIAFQSGPNGIYNAFRRTMVFASIYERCLVIPPFRQHKLQDGVKTKRSFNETFDNQKILKVVDLCDLYEFRKQCGTTIPLDWILFPPTKHTSSFPDNYNPEVEKHYRKQSVLLGDRYVSEFYNNTEISLPQPNVTLFHTQNTRKKIFNEFEKKRCVIYFPAVKSTIATSAQQSYVEKHLVRAPYIRRIAAQIITGLLAEQYAVLHWRNKTGERCLSANGSYCSIRHAKNLKLLKKDSKTIASSLHAYLEKAGLKYLYVAALPYEQFIVKSLRESLFFTYTVEDAYNVSPLLDHYRGDTYVLSLVEQEIAEQATMFIGTTSSSWTFFVENSRNLEGKKTVYIQKLPGIPDKYKSSAGHII